MGRPRKSAKREVMVCVRLSPEEAAALDALRGGLSRSDFLRRLIHGRPTR